MKNLKITLFIIFISLQATLAGCNELGISKQKNTKKIGVLLKEAESLISLNDYEHASSKLKETEKLLIQFISEDTDGYDINDYLPYYSQLFNYKTLIASSAGSTENLPDIYKEVICFIKQYEGWYYSSDYEDIRNLLLISYRTLALDTLEKATDDEGIIEAVKLINDCYTIETAFDNDFKPNYEAKALIYHKAKAISPRFEIEYYYTLEQIVKKNVSIYDEQIKAEIEALTDNNPLPELRFGPPGETFDEAVRRFEKIFDVYINFDQEGYNYTYDYIGYQPFEFSSPSTPDEIIKTEQKNRLPLPSSLKDFYLNTCGGGGNEFNVHGLDIYSPAEICGLMDYIRCGWYGERENDSPEKIRKWYSYWYDDELTESEIAYLQTINDNYKVFGLYYFNEDRIYVLVYGKNGQMGIFDFTQDTWAGDLDILTKKDSPILKYGSVDELISRLFNIVINTERFDNEGWNEPAYRLLERNK